MLRRWLLLVPLALLLLATSLVGDQIYLKSGKKLEGKVVAEHPDRIEVKLASGEVKTISRDDIAMIQKASAGAVEYKKRLKALDADDLDGLLELAAWCQENRLRSQRLSVLKKAIKVDPDCPEANRALLRKWDSSRWVRDKKKGKVPAPQAAAKAKYEAIGLTLTTPTGWKAQDSGAKGLTLGGPSRYRQAVTLEITLSSGDPGFEDAEAGWTGVEEVTFGKLSGRKAERLHKDGSRRMKTREYALSGNGWAHCIRYTSLEVEFEDWLPYVDLVLRSFEVMEPKLDFKHPGLGIGFRFPQDGSWQLQLFQNSQTKEIMFLVLRHQGEGPMGFCVIQYQQVDLSDEAAGNLDTALEGSFGAADVKVKKDTKLGTLAARQWEAETLQKGIPVYAINLAAAQGKKCHLIRFSCHERTVDTYRPTLDLVRDSFVVGVK